MTSRIILFARAVGTVLSWPMVAVAALCVEVVRQVWTTIGDVWMGRMPPKPEADPYEKDRRRREKESADATARRKKRLKNAAEKSQRGALIEEFEEEPEVDDEQLKGER